eukprot:TRINITY_DN3108_c0_g1_i3.p1 TRINITY_DN3108_c0_g1~~TRINITY_DN3108_c0_g1_i3.p1  ORF type:complete len:491 (+),score=138.18 TRINITY_DN3108_c0_g1_i3:197-1669(+)
MAKTFTTPTQEDACVCSTRLAGAFGTMAVPDNLLRPTTQRVIWSGTLLALLFLFSILVTTVPEGRDDLLGPALPTSEIDEIDTGDTAWMNTSTALVLLMTPGLSFFYGGMVRRTSLISTLLQSFVIMGLVLVLWVILGFSLAFGESWNGVRIIGNPSQYYFFRDVGALPNPDLAPTIPFTTYAMFQATFAMITPALFTGAVAERVNFNALMLFVGIWHFLVYCPLAHMEWFPTGLIRNFGHKDFAGGTVVHMSSGYTALMLAHLTGKRSAGASHHTPAHVPYVMLGTALLWFGWFGFNGGSAVASGYLASQALVTTNVATATALLAWILWDYIQGRKVSAIGACGGAVVGLVAITPACGYVTVGGSMIIGIVGAIVSNIALHWFKNLSKVDDTLDVWACHGLGGTTGMLMTSLFATDRVYPDDLNGLFYGSATLFWHTLVVMLCVIPFCLIMTFLIYHVVNVILPFRGEQWYCPVELAASHTAALWLCVF